MNKQIQCDIALHMKGKTAPTKHDMQCFVGMIETGEAIYADFEAAHSKHLADFVKEAKERLSSPSIASVLCDVADDIYASVRDGKESVAFDKYDLVDIVRTIAERLEASHAKS